MVDVSKRKPGTSQLNLVQQLWFRSYYLHFKFERKPFGVKYLCVPARANKFTSNLGLPSRTVNLSPLPERRQLLPVPVRPS